MFKLYIASVLVSVVLCGATSALAQKLAVTIPETAKVEKDYRVKGASVNKLDAMRAALAGEPVVVCDSYRAEMSKNGTISLKKIK